MTKSSEPKMYSCSLQGCKSAWGDSDSMFHHLCGKQLKHQRNYLIHVTKDSLAASLTKSELLNRANEEEERLRDTLEERDYSVINRVQDEEAYLEIRNRDENWSEAKALLTARMDGGDSAAVNSNFQSLGDRNSRSRRGVKREADGNVVKDWRSPITARERADQVIEDLDKLETRIQSNLDLIAGGGWNSVRKITIEAMRQFRFQVGLFEKNAAHRPLVELEFRTLKSEMEELEKNYDAVIHADQK